MNRPNRRAGRRLAAALCCLALCLGLCGCAPAGQADGRPVIVATNFPLYDFARTIAGERFAVRLLLPPGAESHSYEPTPRDILEIQSCALFLYIGGESDAWIDRILGTMGEDAPQTLALIEWVDTLEEAQSPGMTAPGHAHGEPDGREPDEHIWTSLRRAGAMAQAICDAVCGLDPDNSAAYWQACGQLVESFEALDERFAEMIDSAARRTVVVGDRFPFRYFAADYGLRWFAAFPGCSAQSEPSAATVAYLTDLLADEQIPVVFYLEFSNHRVADAIAEAAGARTAVWHSCHNVTRAQLQAGVTYLELMEQNYETLAEALNEHAADNL